MPKLLFWLDFSQELCSIQHSRLLFLHRREPTIRELTFALLAEDEATASETNSKSNTSSKYSN